MHNLYASNFKAACYKIVAKLYKFPINWQIGSPNSLSQPNQGEKMAIHYNFIWKQFEKTMFMLIVL